MIKGFGTSSLLIPLLVGVMAAVSAGQRSRQPLRDGLTIAGVDGQLNAADSNAAERWFFELDSDLSDDKAVIKAGETVELLPSATLEKMTADVKGRRSRGYRIWGRVTEYRGKNFIFPVYFLPLSKAEAADAEGPQDSNLPERSQKQASEQAASVINEANDSLEIPEEILSRLSPKRIVSTEQLKKGLQLKADSILAGRTGLIVEQSDGKVAFVLDALGRNLPKISLPLLACKALEHAQRKQSAEPEPLRFKVSGIVTRYKEQSYLLLQQATRVHSHQNFPR